MSRKEQLRVAVWVHATPSRAAAATDAADAAVWVRAAGATGPLSAWAGLPVLITATGSPAQPVGWRVTACFRS